MASSLLSTRASGIPRIARCCLQEAEKIYSNRLYVCTQCSSFQQQTRSLATTCPSQQQHGRQQLPPASNLVRRRPKVNRNNALFPQVCSGQVRTQMAEAIRIPIEERHDDIAMGPMGQYDRWVESGKLQPDEYQRQIVSKLQRLHDEISNYTPPEVIHPETEELKPQQRGLLSSLFNKHRDDHPNSKRDQDANRAEPPVLFSYDPSIAPTIFNFSSLFSRRNSALPMTNYDPDHTPQGLYMHGDVGTGKTMLMNMFYHTLPPNIKNKKRIHFHQFMQDTHRRLHKLKMEHGGEFDAIPSVAADIAEEASVLCFDEFQCTDVADAMILRRLLECIISHGVILVCTSNRHPNDLYKNGIQRDSFIPCIKLLNTKLEVVNLNSPTDYRKIARPSSGVYFNPIGPKSLAHANKWFAYLGDPKDLPHPTSHVIWGREIKVPMASGLAARFTFEELCMQPRSAADYLELMRHYNAFVVTNIPEMNFNMRDLARRFITFIDAVYESRAALVITSEVPIARLFIGDAEVKATMDKSGEHNLDGSMRQLMDDLGMDMKSLKESSIFTGDEEKFAFARALSRLTEMSSTMWIEQRQVGE